MANIKEKKMSKALTYLQQALAALSYEYSDTFASEAKSHILRAISSLKKKQKQVDQRKERQTEQFNQTWKTSMAQTIKESASRQAVVSGESINSLIWRIREIDKMIEEEKKEIEKLEQESQKKINKTQILND